MQQVVPVECDEWHNGGAETFFFVPVFTTNRICRDRLGTNIGKVGKERHVSAGKYRFPQTFIGPPVNLSTSAGGMVSCSVLPPAFETGWVGIGIGGQATTGGLLEANPNTFTIWANGTWKIFNQTGRVGPLLADREARSGEATGGGGDSVASDGLRWFNLTLRMILEPHKPTFIAGIDGKARENGLLKPFMYKNDRFTKTGSGQT